MQWFRFSTLGVVVCLLLLSGAGAQNPSGNQAAEQSPMLAPNQVAPNQGYGPQGQAQGQSQGAPAGQFGAASSGPLLKLVIGPGDEGDVSVYGVAELSQHVRVNSEGDISLPLVGRVNIGGLSADEAQAAIEKALVDGGFLKSPHVTLAIKDYTSQGITILGEVIRPGTYSPLGARRLYDGFMAAGGLTQRAGSTVAISHKDSKEKPRVVTLSNDAASSADNNVELQPGDTVVVSRAGVVYVVGEVVRPGGFVIENASGITLMQIWAMASGPTRLANLSHSMVVRKTADGKIQNTPVDIKKIVSAKAPDIALQADDILFVPPSNRKMAMDKGASSAFSMITNLALYRF